ncbi:MAG: segregation/condensation protein A [Nitrospinae bacterium]|nr:segregation/condensation protein A [Nitrospinota bacterium]
MSYNVKLDVFEGPLDLLLHLIKENQLDIYDIPIATITERYLEYIEIMKSLNLEVAGEFLVMAATLTYIKSKMLLPKPEVAEEEAMEEGEDPREELIHKLVEYKKFKEAALKLREMELDQTQTFTRIPSKADMPDEGEILLEVSVFELLGAFQKILQRFGAESKYTVTLEEMSVTDKINEMMTRLDTEEFITFDSLFATSRVKMEIIATFLALLEVMRLKLARASQTRAGGEIVIYKAIEDEGPIGAQEPELPLGGAAENVEPSNPPAAPGPAERPVEENNLGE